MDDLPKPLTYEETPVIEPEQSSHLSAVSSQQEDQTPQGPTSPPPEPPAPAVSAPAPIESGQAPPPGRRGPSLLSLIGNLLFFAILFGIGMWLSTVIRPYLPGAVPTTSAPTTAPAVTREPALPTLPPDPYAGWQTYQVISAANRQPVAGVSFKLPPDVLSPICDGTNCASQGTYLPGGTRFTVAARGAGQVLRDYRGAIVTDVLGQPFTTKDTLVAGKSGVSFTGTFTGTTIGGYSFSRMAGAMIPVTDTLSVEINHFTPSGVTADFETDASLFEKILASVVVTGALGGEKGATMPLISPAGSPAASPTVEPLR